MSGDSTRLPRDVVPRRYDLTIVPDLDAARFTGEVTIALDVTQRVAEVVLHAHELDVELETLAQSGRNLDATLTADPDAERVRIAAPDLALGSATLTLRFRGVLSDNLVGFYRSTYTDDDGTTRTLAATQFEAPHARRAFPCFDEPEFKAVFAITLVVADGLLAISNGPEIDRESLRRRARPCPVRRRRSRCRRTSSRGSSARSSSPSRSTRAASRCASRTSPGKATSTRSRSTSARSRSQFFADYYGIPYPGREVRSRRAPRLLVRRDGEPRAA